VPVGIAAGWVAACATSAVLALQWLLAGEGGTRAPLTYVVAAVVMGVLLRRIGRFRWWTWAAFPVPVAFFVLVFARSIWCTYVRRVVVWRGRRIPLLDATPTTDPGQ
jgi:4,4'-diaponeurosporenoate glycosyltransferase